MIFNKHLDLEGQHALLGASKYHWINYSDEKFEVFYESSKAVERGTRLHAIAKSLIEEKIKLPRVNATLNMYVNDAIGYDMIPEQVLYYSKYVFGTVDTISFLEKKSILRIHDLKTGSTPAHIEQLRIYAALFFLEYDIKPKDVETKLRIYQNDDIFRDYPKLDEIVPIMDKAKTFTRMAMSMDEGR